MVDRGCAKSAFALVRNLFFAAALYGSVYSIIYLYENGGATRAHQLLQGAVSLPDLGIPSNLPIVDLPSDKVKIEKINPNANWFNRPESLVVAKDDFLGKRPDVDTIANLTMLVEECRGSYEKFEKMRNVFDCLQFLEKGEKQYFYLPDHADRASTQSPRRAEYNNADGHDNSLNEYPEYKPATKDSIGQCPGPIVPYHTYWTGPATWRVELFVKSYLYTQNLPCSRLFIWLDSDRNKNAVEQMLTTDALFAPFLPFVERGDIKVVAWNFPSRIPLPEGDNTDGVGYYKTPGKPNAAGEQVVADGLIRDSDGQEWLVLTEKQMTFLPVAISDAVRFVVLHIYGGVYFDMDVSMMRDFRPMLIGDEHSFAERWAAHDTPGDYNTAVMSLTANSSLSSYMLRGGVRMGMNFHPRVLGRMAVKDGRNQEFLMLETAAFDPIWTEFNWARKGRCTVPCFKDYGQVFLGKENAIKGEWESYDGEQLEHIIEPKKKSSRDVQIRGRATIPVPEAETFDQEALSKTPYKIEEDRYPPNNRTLENFFRGAWSYHIHNQWLKNPQPSSWFSVIQHAQDGFFAGKRMNPYGEKWNGPSLPPYQHSWEYA